jgi:PKD repeat protein
MSKKTCFLFCILILQQFAYGQCPSPLFSLNDSIPEGSSLNITNTGTGAQEFHWDFATGDPDSIAQGAVLPFNFAAYEQTIVEENGNYYGFVLNYGGTQITRLDFGDSLSKPPIITPLPNNAMTTTSTGIDLVKEGNKWYGFVSDYSQNTCFKLEFDSITQLNPVVTNLNVTGIAIAYQVSVFEHVVFLSSYSNGKIVRLDFGNSYANTPVQLADITGFTNPIGVDVSFDDATGKYIGMVGEFGKISKMDFGNSLLNNPSIAVIHTPATSGFTYGLDIIRDGRNWYVLAVTGYSHLITLKLPYSLDNPAILLSDSDLGVLTGTLVGLTIIKDKSQWHGFINNTANLFFYFTYPNFSECSPNNSNVESPTGLIYNVDQPGFRYIELAATDSISQCTRYSLDSVFVRIAPVVNFSTSPACSNAPVLFSDQTIAVADSIIDWFWDFGDASTSNMQNPSHNFLSGGNYNVTLIVQTLYGYTDSITTNIIINNPPVAGFSFSNNSCANLPIALTDTSINGSAQITMWNWDFGNGDTSSSANPVANYDSASTYLITLTVADQTGCSSTVSNNLTTVAAPAAQFSATNTCINEGAVFQNLTDSNAISSVTYYWDFGNQQTSNLINPVEVYNNDTLYDVMLIATGSNGCIDTIVNSIQISHRPNPAFLFTPMIACTGNIITITDSSTANSGENILYRHWDFGDGDTLLNDSITSHVYSASGNYNITLTVATPFFCDTSISQTVTVRESPAANFNVTNACFGTAVNFSNLSVAVSGDPIVSYNWDFGDTTGSMNTNTSHLYNAPGTYNVSLLATSQTGCIDSIIIPASTFINPVADFTNYPLVCTDTATVFVNLSTIVNDTISNWLWSFGDNDTSTAENPSHIYLQPGNVPVTLTATSIKGCSSSITNILSINPSPSPAIIYTPTCLGETTCFTYIENNVPANTILNWLWTFGDNTLSNIPAPCHTYANAGLPLVTLQVLDNKGCKGTVSIPALINATPSANFTNSLACTNGIINFSDLSSVTQGQILEWDWLFGVADTSSQQNPMFSTATPGLIPVKLIVNTDAGCRDTVTNYININLSPVAQFTMSPLISAPGEAVNFISNSLYSDDYVWLYGDGNTGTSDSIVSHTYQDTALYSVTLITLKNNGCSDTITLLHPVIIPKPDIAVLDINAKTIANYLEVSAVVFNSGNIDIRNFELNVSLDGVNSLNELVQLNLPLASSAKSYTFSSRIKISDNNPPAYLCVEALQPNGFNDVNTLDNYLCESIETEFEILDISPNPSSEQALLKFNLKQKGFIKLKAYDPSGKIILSEESEQLDKGFHSISINTASWSKGLYAISLENNDVVKVRKQMKH